MSLTHLRPLLATDEFFFSTGRAHLNLKITPTPGSGIGESSDQSQRTTGNQAMYILTPTLSFSLPVSALYSHFPYNLY